VSARFGGFGAWHARRNSAVFCWSVRPTIGIHGNSAAVDFPESGIDRFFDQTSKVMEALSDRVRENYVFRKNWPSVFR
jgi:hypothetical protein